MIRKAALQMALPALLILVGMNAYLAVHHFQRIRASAGDSGESSAIQGDIAAVLQDMTDMESGQRGYLLTEDTEYLKPYNVAKGTIGKHFADLRTEFANRGEQERAQETQLEALANSKQAEMEKTIDLRQQGYRKRAFVMVNTNEGRGYMEQARGILVSLATAESWRLARLEEAKKNEINQALSQTILANLCLLAITACVFWLIRYHERGLERETTESQQALGAREAELKKVTSALGEQARSKIEVIEENTRMLIDKFGGFLPRLGFEYAEQIRESAGEMEQLRRELVQGPAAEIPKKAA